MVGASASGASGEAVEEDREAEPREDARGWPSVSVPECLRGAWRGVRLHGLKGSESEGVRVAAGRVGARATGPIATDGLGET